MGPRDNATNPYDAPAPAPVGRTDSSYYRDGGRLGSACFSPFLLQQNSPTTPFYNTQAARCAEDQNSESNSNYNNETANADNMDASGYVGYVTNPTAVSAQMYGAATAAAATPSSQADSISWLPVATASTATTTQPFMSPQPNPYAVNGVGTETVFYEVDPQYDASVVSVGAISPGDHYPDPMSPSTAGMSAQSTRRKKSRSHRQSSGSANSRPVLTIDGLPHQPRTTQLRTAQRSSKYSNSSHKPAETAEERKARAMHNQVEQQYRKRLNAQFERLLAALPPEDSSSSDNSGASAPGGHIVDSENRRVSKAEVLDRASQRIKTLEKERRSLERQKRELVGSVGRLRDEWSRRMGGSRLDGN
ncbi:hypothetical protein MKZ38_005002 [Zalerion maritima]|uniref:BHLH domain-containing protein n=1 Tax=Zalerion maritima TaxID=339359 RepID=A0AAD5RKS2_9PEZI|nr:hypothetical protein MKZ38_005002 [Zalerion maritima]